MAGDARYLKLLEEMKELHERKNKGYSGDSEDRWANFRMSEEFGVSAFLGCMIRLSDKYIRVQNLIKNPKNEQEGESIKDTLMDLSAYALIAICLLEEEEDWSQPSAFHGVLEMVNPNSPEWQRRKKLDEDSK